jgi:Fe-S-cluster containining protein
MKMADADLEVLEPITKKEGSCKRCGECCKWISIGKVDTNNDTGEYARFVLVRGGKIVNGNAFLPSKCPYIESDNLCGVFDKRPTFCKVFPIEEMEWLKDLGCKYYE